MFLEQYPSKWFSAIDKSSVSSIAMGKLVKLQEPSVEDYVSEIWYSGLAIRIGSSNWLLGKCPRMKRQSG